LFEDTHDRTPRPRGLIVPNDASRVESLAVLSRFRTDFYACLTARVDALFELTDALLCTEGPVRTLVGLSLAPEHRRGHGAMYDALNKGWIDVDRLRTDLARLPLPRYCGRLVLAVDVSAWLRPDAATSPDRLFCHVYGRGKNQAQLIPGWPYSFIAALEPGRPPRSAGPRNTASSSASPTRRPGRPRRSPRAPPPAGTAPRTPGPGTTCTPG
jgi:hypothetical protein